ncbi:MAG: 16S rRNA (guanine(966)-N(2))-methyltransferase RsmD [Pseudomonadota bacterium]
MSAGKSKPRPRPQAAGYPGRLRIIAGQWRGRRLPVPEAPGLRPTPDRVRETLFNWLAPYLEGATCLDLFAGTGALCLEALSRRAARAIMVEQAAPVVEALRRNVQTLNAHGAEVRHADAVEFLQGPPQPVDILFLDPPFASDLIGRCAALAEARGWVRPGGLIYIEAPSRLQALPLPPNWELVRSKAAGQVGYHLARRVVSGKQQG